MLRVYKQYHYGFLGNTLSMSSSPGLLHSKDDFYALKNGLIVMETTNSIYNQTLYSLYITPQSLFSWQRATIANFFAMNGQEWTSLFGQYNSGTYNNQWMVIDMNTLSRQGNNFILPSKDLLWIIEQIPGKTRAADVTDVLVKQGYWSSFNIPFFEDIFNASGYPEQVAIYGDEDTYENNPRAKIFRRDQNLVTDLTAMKHMMRYNDYQTDPFSLGIPIWGVSARADLPGPADPPYIKVAFGGVDSKAVSAVALSTKLTVAAISGPTTDQQIPFAWTAFPHVSHVGLPPVFNFSWIDIEASTC